MQKFISIFFQQNMTVKAYTRQESAKYMGTLASGWWKFVSVVSMVVIPKERNIDDLHPVFDYTLLTSKCFSY